MSRTHKEVLLATLEACRGRLAEKTALLPRLLEDIQAETRQKNALEAALATAIGAEQAHITDDTALNDLFAPTRDRVYVSVNPVPPAAEDLTASVARLLSTRREPTQLATVQRFAHRRRQR